MRSNDRGFTLLEVLAALLIMVIALAVLGNIIQGSIGQATYARDERTVALLADQKIAQLMLSTNLDSETPSGTFDGYPDYSWSFTQSPKTLSVDKADGTKQDQGQFIEIDLQVNVPGRTQPWTITAHRLVDTTAQQQGQQGQGTQGH